jgi:hypothetical protein
LSSRLTECLCVGLAVAISCLGIRPALCEEPGRELGRVKIKPLRETSGIAASRQNADTVWLHNDGETAHLFAVKTSGKVAGQVRLPAGIEDLEDIAIGPGAGDAGDCLHLGDIGDNDADRREVRVLRFVEPRLDAVANLVARDVEAFRLTYPDGSHDAEALMVDPLTGDLLIATKQDGRTRVYRAAAVQLQNGERTELQAIATLSIGGVSAGDISADGRRLALRSESKGWLWKRGGDEPWDEVFLNEPREIPVRGRRQSENGEAIAIAHDGASYLTISEGKNERLYAFPIGDISDSPRN